MALCASHCCWPQVEQFPEVGRVRVGLVRGRGGATRSIAVARSDSTGTLLSDVGTLTPLRQAKTHLCSELTKLFLFV